MAEPWSDGDVPSASELAGLPWGVMGYANGSTSDQTSISSETDITGLSVAFTAISSRLYRTTLTMTVTQVSSTGTITGRISNAANSLIASAQATLAAGSTTQITVTSVETGISGATTRKARIDTSAGTVTVEGSSTIRARLVVEDLGPG